MSASEHWRYAALFLATCLVYLCTFSEGRFYSVSDGQVMFDTAVSMHKFGELGISPEFDLHGGRPGRNDHYGKYGLGLSVVEQLPLLIAPVVERTFGQAGSNVMLGLAILSLTALTALLVALCLQALGCCFPISALGSLAFAFSTFAWPYISYDFSEPLQEFCLVLAFWLLLRTVHYRRDSASILCGFTLGFAVLTKASLLLLIPCYTAYLWVGSQSSIRVRRLALFLLPLCAWGVGIGWLNWYRFGSILDFGYGEEAAQFTNPLLTGLYGLLLGPNKGLIFYAPVAILLPWALWRLRKSHRREMIFFAGMILVQTVVTALWWSWEGGWSWGPRMLLPVVPFVLIATGLLFQNVRRSRIPFAVLGALGLGINLLGVLIHFNVWPSVISSSRFLLPLNIVGRPSSEFIVQNGRRLYYPFVGTYYVPALSPILGHAWLLQLRYLGVPVSVELLEQLSSPKPRIDFPPIQIDFSLLNRDDRFLFAQLRHTNFWLWNVLTRQPTPEVFSYPAFALALEHQGDRAVSNHQMDRALDCFRLAIQLMPNNVSPALKLANVQVQMGRSRDAELILSEYLTVAAHSMRGMDQALRLPQMRAAHLRLGQIYENAGNRVAAIGEYQAFLALAPPDQDRLTIEKRLLELDKQTSR